MEKTKGKEHPHHGKNIKLARKIKDMSQEDLALAMNVSQMEISRLERLEEIDDKTLGQIAEKMGISVGFFKTFEPDELFKSFNMYDSVKENENTYSMSGTEETQTNNTLQQGEQENITNNYSEPLEKVSELFERIIDLSAKLAVAESEKQELLKEIAALKAEMERLKK
ncbi:helix-turn-helix domain-containing protein [Dysgonomonas sp. 511]|uniref:helix-turn-helix domain-containing protein n=1 Tax=Dysgonomonas sp. 511 TaxID=2302930 RepID=UPI0013D45640|nr:helix-turn-helix transcriptional regulator [Dysgonomonas sp. 511]NDV80046.1 helix-turn-helix domain-containing protein [Dysgonomonas sp. 511]